MEISIAIGKSRKTLVWRNTKMTWQSLADRLSRTDRTHETYREYCSFSKDKKATIKDHGGFVGGYLSDGSRHPENVKFRQILTLDLDLADNDFWDDFKMFYDIEAVMHTTHRHSVKTPGYRVVIPLSRQVDATEYEAIGRKFANTLDINLFDPTTFQPERLMYWPTTSKDGIFLFEHQQGALLDADLILSSYTDYKDISEWPMLEAEKDFKRLGGKEQGTPADKPGYIGAFCRVYDIHAAIAEFLPEVYENEGDPGRYSFIEGSGSNGAIVYGDDEFLYSFHGTDPAQGQLCNAYDLVRIHKFGHEDTDKGEKEISKKESQRLMNQFAASLPKVIEQIGRARLPQDDFDDFYDTTWLGKLTVDKYSKYENTIPNFYLILNNDINLRGRLKFDKFHIREVVEKPVPWDEEAEGQQEFTDKDDAGLQHYLENKYNIYHETKIKKAMDMVFIKNAFHPITDYLDTLVWDQESRLDTLLIDYLGADDTEFNRLATRKAFVAAVARVYRPGCKFDYVLTLIGKEGIKKSTLFDKMGGKWFSDSFLGVDGNKAFEQLQGSWIIEIAELSGIRRSEAEAVKHFIAKKIDKFRVAYGKRNQEFPRQCIFVGTTNDFNFLKENNGNRRFWPVVVSDFGMLDMDEMPIDQIWAEAKAYYDANEKLYLDADIEEDAREVQRTHTEYDDRHGLIADYLCKLLPADWAKMDVYERRSFLTAGEKDDLTKPGEVKRLSVCVAEIWTELFQANFKDMTTHNTKYIHQILSDMPGWEKARSNLTFPIYGKQRSYVLATAEIKHHNKREAKRKN